MSDGRIVESLEAGHRGTTPFDRAMILPSNIVELLVAPYFEVPPLRMSTGMRSNVAVVAIPPDYRIISCRIHVAI